MRASSSFLLVVGLGAPAASGAVAMVGGVWVVVRREEWREVSPWLGILDRRAWKRAASAVQKKEDKDGDEAE